MANSRRNTSASIRVCAIPLLMLLPLLAWAGNSPKVLMSYWCAGCKLQLNDPVPGSLNAKGNVQQNPVFQEQVSDINVIAYAFLQVNQQGRIYFAHPHVDLRASDVNGYCAQYRESCPGATSAKDGSFAAFAKLDNPGHVLKKIISIGGAGHFESFRYAVAHQREFVNSVAALLDAYHLDGVDLDDEPPGLFDKSSASGLLQLVQALRTKLGQTAFISVEIASDWETLQSMDKSTLQTWHDNLADMAESAYLSVMGYGFHEPLYPGAATGNSSNLYSDPKEPLLPDYYHSSDSQTIQYLTFEGVPPAKIILGFPATVIIYGGVQAEPGTYGLYQPFDKKLTPSGDLGTGLASYRLVEKYLQHDFTQHYLVIDGMDSAVFAYNQSKRQWISYEDPETIAAKAKYAVRKGLAGLMMWDLNLDAPMTSRQSLLRAAYQGLSTRLGANKQD